MTDIVDRASRFAADAHAGQIRKYTGEPYIVHPLAVLAIVRSIPHTDEMLAAAVLHDVVEDTPRTLADVTDAFGAEVASLVFWLTRPAGAAEIRSRLAKAKLDRERLRNAPPQAQTIKLADIIDNLGSLKSRDPVFWQTYSAEKQMVLEVLTSGDPVLLRRAGVLLEPD